MYFSKLYKDYCDHILYRYIGICTSYYIQYPSIRHTCILLYTVLIYKLYKGFTRKLCPKCVYIHFVNTYMYYIGTYIYIPMFYSYNTSRETLFFYNYISDPRVDLETILHIQIYMYVVRTMCALKPISLQRLLELFNSEVFRRL